MSELERDPVVREEKWLDESLGVGREMGGLLYCEFTTAMTPHIIH